MKPVTIVITHEDVMPVANRVIPQLEERVFDDARAALTDAFMEGVRAAYAEMVAQLDEQGIPITSDLRVIEALGESDE